MSNSEDGYTEEVFLEEFISEGILEKDSEADPWHDSRNAVTNESSLKLEPYKWICSIEKVLEKRSDNSKLVGLGTGFLVKGLNAIFTAGHNLKNLRRDLRLKSIKVRFPCMGENIQFEVEEEELEEFVWLHSDPQMDFGVIGLPGSMGSFSTNKGCGLPFKTLNDSYLRTNDVVLIAGFPAPRDLKKPLTKKDEDLKTKNPNMPATGEKTLVLYDLFGKSRKDWPVMVEAAGTIKEILEKDSIFHHKVDTEAGNSGSPIMKWRCGEWSVVGVHVAGDDSRKFNFGTFFSENLLRKIEKWSNKIATATEVPGREDEAVPFFDQPYTAAVPSAPSFTPHSDPSNQGVTSTSRISSTRIVGRNRGNSVIGKMRANRGTVGGPRPYKGSDPETDSDSEDEDDPKPKKSNTSMTSHNLKGATIGTNAPIGKIGILKGGIQVGGGTVTNMRVVNSNSVIGNQITCDNLDVEGDFIL